MEPEKSFKERIERPLKTGKEEIDDAFNNKLAEVLALVRNILRGRDVSEDFRENTFIEAFRLLEEHPDEIEAGLARRSENVLEILTNLFEYSNRGNWHDRESGDFSDDELTRRYDIGEKILLFLNDRKDTVREFSVKCFTYDANEAPIPAGILERTVERFLGEYTERAYLEKDEKNALSSVLSFMHTALPLSRMYEEHCRGKVEFTDAGFTFIEHLKRLNRFSLLSGDKTSIDAIVKQFLSGADMEENGSVFPKINRLFPEQPQRRLENPFLAEALRNEQIVEIYLENGFSEEEISRTADIFEESSGGRVARRILESYDLPWSELFDVWKDSVFSESIDKNLTIIRDLEKRQKGSARMLFNPPYNFRCFGRYSTEDLLEQLEPLCCDAEYGIMVTSYGDENNSFRNSGGLYRKIKEKAEKMNIKTRMIEFPSKIDDMSALPLELFAIAPVSPQGDPIPFDFIFINMHWGETKFAEDFLQYWNYVFGVGPERSSLIIRHGGAVAGLMCSAGEKGNTMERLALEYDITATGSDKYVYGVNSVDLLRDDSGRMSFDIGYRYQNETEAKKAKMMVYKHKNDDVSGVSE